MKSYSITYTLLATTESQNYTGFDRDIPPNLRILQYGGDWEDVVKLAHAKLYSITYTLLAIATSPEYREARDKQAKLVQEAQESISRAPLS